MNVRESDLWLNPFPPPLGFEGKRWMMFRYTESNGRPNPGWVNADSKKWMFVGPEEIVPVHEGSDERDY